MSRPEDSIHAPAHFAAKANMRHRDYVHEYAESERDPDAFWGRIGERLEWMRKPEVVRNVSYDLADFRIKWYEDGELNASVNCLDRHLRDRGDKTAIVFEPDDPATPARTLTYRELYQQTCRLANAMRAMGVGKGDRVTIYLPMIPEAAVAMLACARIGAVHTVVFGGFAPQSIADRIADSGSTLVITADEGRRGGRSVPLGRPTWTRRCGWPGTEFGTKKCWCCATPTARSTSTPAVTCGGTRRWPTSPRPASRNA
jgi:acetyl-coenzyme A synthetase (EC 6.2.1.1)